MNWRDFRHVLGLYTAAEVVQRSNRRSEAYREHIAATIRHRRAELRRDCMELAIRSGATGDEIIALAEKLAAHLEAIREGQAA